MKALRMEMRLRNNILYQAIFAKWKSVGAFCKEFDLDYGRVTGYLNLSANPFKKNGGYTKTALATAKALLILEDDLFPRQIYRIETTVATVEIDLKELPAGRNFPRLASEDDTYQAMVHAELSRAMSTALKIHLHPRERKVLEMRYGLNGHDEHTCEEVGNKLGVSGTRIQQIEKGALRKLRKSIPAKRHLRPFHQPD